MSPEETFRSDKNASKISYKPVTAKRGEYQKTFQNPTPTTNHQSPVLKTFDIGTYNFRSLRTDAKVAELEKLLEGSIRMTQWYPRGKKRRKV